MLTRRRYGFRSTNQRPLFMVWEETWVDGMMLHATVLFNSEHWIGI